MPIISIEGSYQQLSRRTAPSMIMPAVQEESLMIANQQNSFSGIVEEAKTSSLIFDSYTSLDGPNGGEFGLSLEAALTSDCVNKFKSSPHHFNGASNTKSSISKSPRGPCLSSIPSQDEAEVATIESETSLDDNLKPKRPLSAYNLFFQLERERLIAGTSDLPFTAEDVERIADARRIQMMNDSQPKRKHRKSHGKISFAELARVIAANWKSLKSSEKDMLRERAAAEKSRYLKELEEWTKNSNKEIERRTSIGPHHIQQDLQRQQQLNCSDRSGSPSDCDDDLHGPLLDRSINSRNTPKHCLQLQSLAWQHESSSAYLDGDQHHSAPPSPLTMPPPPIHTPATRQPSIMWQHEDSIADLQDTVPQPPLWRSPSTVMHVLGGDNHPASMNNHLDNSCVMGMSSEVGGISMMSMSSVSDLPLNDLCDNDVNDSYGGAVAAFQDDDDFRAPSNRNFLFPRKFNIAPLYELQQQRQQHHQDYVSMFQKMDVHDASMRNMMMMQHQQQQQYHYEHEPVHQMSLRQHLSYGASFQQQQQHQEFQRTMNAPSIPFIDTQRRVRRPRRKSAPTANPGNTCDDLTSGDEQQLQQQLRRATFSASNHNKTFQNDEQFQLNRLLATFDD